MHKFIKVDEVYEHILYEGEHVPFASVSESAFARTCSIYSGGKTFSATGWKIGWIIGANSQIMHRIRIAQQFVVFSVATPLQAAIATALRTANDAYEGYPTYYEWLRSQYQRKRDLLVDTLRECGMIPVVPEGAFFIMTHVPDSIMDLAVDRSQLPTQIAEYVAKGSLEIDPATENSRDYNICRNLVIQRKVAAIPPSAFYCPEHRAGNEMAQSFARFAFCKKDDVLLDARKRLLKR